MGFLNIVGTTALQAAKRIFDESNRYTEEYDKLSDWDLKVKLADLEIKNGGKIEKNAIEGLLRLRGYYDSGYGMWFKRDGSDIASGKKAQRTQGKENEMQDEGE